VGGLSRLSSNLSRPEIGPITVTIEPWLHLVVLDEVARGRMLLTPWLSPIPTVTEGLQIKKLRIMNAAPPPRNGIRPIQAQREGVGKEDYD
jgi:hypothetical protein